LLEGPNPRSVKILETLADPKLLMESMFSHFKKLYIYMVLSKGADGSKNTMVEESLILAYQDPAYQKSMNKTLDVYGRLTRACLDSMNREYELGGNATPKKKKNVMTSAAKDLISKVFPDVKIKIVESGARKFIPNCLENCLDKVLKLSHLQDLWLLDESFLQGTMMYKMGLLYYQILVSPENMGKRFVPYLENKIVETNKIMRSNAEIEELVKKKAKGKNTNAEDGQEQATSLNPNLSILYFIEENRRQIELVNRSGSHQKVTFFNNPRYKFLSDETKHKFEQRYAIEDSASKMTSMLKEW
jgi:hypothetical protein